MDIQADIHEEIYHYLKNWNTKGKQEFEINHKEMEEIIKCNASLVHPFELMPILTAKVMLGHQVRHHRSQMTKRVLNYLFEIGLDFVEIEEIKIYMERIDIENGDVIYSDDINDLSYKVKYFHYCIEDWFINQLVDEGLLDVNTDNKVCISDKGLKRLKQLNFKPYYKEIKVSDYKRKDGKVVKGYTYKRIVNTPFWDENEKNKKG